MIQSFKHRGLKRLYDYDDKRGVSAGHVDKFKRVLARLDEATDIRNMALPRLWAARAQGQTEGHLGRVCVRQLADRFSFREGKRLRCRSR